MDSLEELCSSVKRLRDTIQCPICCDVLSDPVSTRCNHHFCNDCYKKFCKIRGNNSCPVCQTSVSRRSVINNESVKETVAAVVKLIDSLKEDTGIDFLTETLKPVSTREAAFIEFKKPYEKGEHSRNLPRDNIKKDDSSSRSNNAKQYEKPKYSKQYQGKRKVLDDSFIFLADIICPPPKKQKESVMKADDKVEEWLLKNEEDLNKVEDISIVNGNFSEKTPSGGKNDSLSDEEFLSVSQVDNARVYVASPKCSRDLGISEGKTSDTEIKLHGNVLPQTSDPYEFVSSQNSNQQTVQKSKGKSKSRKSWKIMLQDIKESFPKHQMKTQLHDNTFVDGIDVNDTFDNLFAMSNTKQPLKTYENLKESVAVPVHKKEGITSYVKSFPSIIKEEEKVEKEDKNSSISDDFLSDIEEQEELKRQNLKQRGKQSLRSLTDNKQSRRSVPSLSENTLKKSENLNCKRSRTIGSRKSGRRSKEKMNITKEIDRQINERKEIERLQHEFEDVDNYHLVTASQVEREMQEAEKNAIHDAKTVLLQPPVKLKEMVKSDDEKISGSDEKIEEVISADESQGKEEDVEVCPQSQGWSRINEIKKVMNNSVKLPLRTLNVSTELLKKGPIVHLKNISDPNSVLHSEICEISKKENSAKYDIHTQPTPKKNTILAKNITHENTHIDKNEVSSGINVNRQIFNVCVLKSPESESKHSFPSPGEPVKYLNLTQAEERSKLMNAIVQSYESSLQNNEESTKSCQNPAKIPLSCESNISVNLSGVVDLELAAKKEGLAQYVAVKTYPAVKVVHWQEQSQPSIVLCSNDSTPDDLNAASQMNNKNELQTETMQMSSSIEQTSIRQYRTETIKEDLAKQCSEKQSESVCMEIPDMKEKENNQGNSQSQFIFKGTSSLDPFKSSEKSSEDFVPVRQVTRSPKQIVQFFKSSKFSSHSLPHVKFFYLGTCMSQGERDYKYTRWLVKISCVTPCLSCGSTAIKKDQVQQIDLHKSGSIRKPMDIFSCKAIEETEIEPPNVSLSSKTKSELEVYDKSKDSETSTYTLKNTPQKISTVTVSKGQSPINCDNCRVDTVSGHMSNMDSSQCALDSSPVFTAHNKRVQPLEELSDDSEDNKPVAKKAHLLQEAKSDNGDIEFVDLLSPVNEEISCNINELSKQKQCSPPNTEDYLLNSEELLKRVMDNIDEDIGLKSSPHESSKDCRTALGNEKFISATVSHIESPSAISKQHSQKKTYEKIKHTFGSDNDIEENDVFGDDDEMDVIEDTPVKQNNISKDIPSINKTLANEKQLANNEDLSKSFQSPSQGTMIKCGSIIRALGSSPKSSFGHSSMKVPSEKLCRNLFANAVHSKHEIMFEKISTPVRNVSQHSITSNKEIGSKTQRTLESKKITESAFTEMTKTSIPKLKESSVPTSDQTKSVNNSASSSVCNKIKSPEKRKSSPTSKMHFVCSGLHENMVQKVKEFAKKVGAGFSDTFTISMTHLIVCVDENRTTPRTLKYLQAVAAGKWVVSYFWIIASASAERILPEESFEALDSSGGDGPHRSRTSKYGLFRNVQMCCVTPVEGMTVDKLQEIIMMCGGIVVEKPEDFSNSQEGFHIIIGADGEVEESQCYEWLHKYRAVSVHDMWVLHCVDSYSFQPLPNYYLAPFSIDEVSECGIPDELLVEEDWETTAGVSEVSGLTSLK